MSIFIEQNIHLDRADISVETDKIPGTYIGLRVTINSTTELIFWCRNRKQRDNLIRAFTNSEPYHDPAAE